MYRDGWMKKTCNSDVQLEVSRLFTLTLRHVQLNNVEIFHASVMWTVDEMTTNVQIYACVY